VRAIKGQSVGGNLEVCSRDRFIAVTADRYPGTPATLAARPDYLARLSARYAAKTTRSVRAPYVGPVTTALGDLAGALRTKLDAWHLPITRLKKWSDGYLAELQVCPWAEAHTTDGGGAAIAIHASGAMDFTCLHAH
jgi:hypothetical protein